MSTQDTNTQEQGREQGNVGGATTELNPDARA